jgi:hypothetical protein
VARARYLPGRSGILLLKDPVELVVVVRTVLHRPETRRWTLTGTLATQSVKAGSSVELTLPRATRCFLRLSVTLLAWSTGNGGQWMSGGGTWKAVPLRTAPSPITSLKVLTRIGPSAASDGTSTLSVVGVSALGTVCVAVVAYGAKRTSVCVVAGSALARRFVPAIATVVPADAEHGVMEVMVGEQAPGFAFVKSDGLLAVSLALVTWIVPLASPATVAQISFPEMTLNADTGVPPISTLVTIGSLKFVPVITTTHPAGPLVGENDEMVGGVADAGV